MHFAKRKTRIFTTFKNTQFYTGGVTRLSKNIYCTGSAFIASVTVDVFGTVCTVLVF